MKDKLWILSSDPPGADIAPRTDDRLKGVYGFFPFQHIPAWGQDPDPYLASIAFGAIACNSKGEIHICGAAPVDLGIWHALGTPGQWGRGFSNVQDQTDRHGGVHLASVARVACATNQSDDLHVLAITRRFTDLYHTIRCANGDWPYPFSWVNLEARGGGPEIVGETPFCDCATNPWGDFHIVAVNRAGMLYHTIRYGPPYGVLGTGPQNRTEKEGTWHQWGELQFTIDPLGHALGPVCQTEELASSVSCAVNGDGDLHVCVLDSHQRLYHTIRRGPYYPGAEGTWYRWEDVEAEAKEAHGDRGVIGLAAGISLPLTDVTCACRPAGELDVVVANLRRRRGPFDPGGPAGTITPGDMYFVQRGAASVAGWSAVEGVGTLLRVNRICRHNSVSHD